MKSGLESIPKFILMKFPTKANKLVFSQRTALVHLCTNITYSDFYYIIKNPITRKI